MEETYVELFRWSEELTSKLIQCRYARREEFRAVGKGTTRDIWVAIIKDLDMESQLTPLQVRKKWNSLMHRFREIENKISAGSGSEELSWPHYNEMQTIMNELGLQEIPSILATGNDNETVKIQFSDLNAAEPFLNDDEINTQKSAKRDKRDIIDERFICAVEQGNQQLKELQATLERQGDAFLQLMSRLISAVENPVPDDMSM